MATTKNLHRLGGDSSGATAIEFAIVASALFTLMLGILEYGLFMFTKAQVDAITYQASREVGIGRVRAGCTDRVSCIIKLVNDKAGGLIDEQSLRVTAAVVSTPSSGAPEIPDICLDNINTPYPPSCIKWVENNGVPGYQRSGGLGAASIGKAGDLVEIRVTYLWRVLFPMFRSHISKDGVLTITSTTVVKNEPF